MLHVPWDSPVPTFSQSYPNLTGDDNAREGDTAPRLHRITFNSGGRHLLTQRDTVLHDETVYIDGQNIGGKAGTGDSGARQCSARNSLRPLATEAAGKGKVLRLTTHRG